MRKTTAAQSEVESLEKLNNFTELCFSGLGLSNLCFIPELVQAYVSL